MGHNKEYCVTDYLHIASCPYTGRPHSHLFLESPACFGCTLSDVILRPQRLAILLMYLIVHFAWSNRVFPWINICATSAARSDHRWRTSWPVHADRVVGCEFSYGWIGPTIGLIGIRFVGIKQRSGYVSSVGGQWIGSGS